MAFSSGAQRDLYYKAETTFGTEAGDATLNFYELRNTEDSLNLVRDNFVSDERRGDRGIHDMRLGNKQPAGDIGFEFSYAEFDNFIEAALGGTWTADVVKAGSTPRSFTLVRAFSDILQYQRFTGSVINTMSLEINPNAMVTGSFGFISKNMDSGSGTYVDSATLTDVTTNRPFDGFTGAITEGGSSIAVVSAFSMSLDNGFERNFVLMNATNPQVTSGKSNITGSVTLYFKNTIEYTKFVNETESSLAIQLNDAVDGSGNPSGNQYDIELPRIKYTSADVPVNSDGVIMITMNFQALYDATEESNIVITKTDAA